MLSSLLNIPETEDEWNIWSFHHQDSHRRIIDAISAQRGVNLGQYIFDPIDLENPQTFLDRNARAHTDMNSTLNLGGSDLQNVDFENERQKAAWWWLHYNEHLAAERALGIG